MVLADSSPKAIWKILNDALGRICKSTDVKQLIDEIRNNEIVSGNKIIAEKDNNYYTNIGNSYSKNFF